MTNQTIHSECSFDEFVEAYQPIINPINGCAAFDGLMFETYGAELNFVEAQNPHKIWTLIEAEGSLEIISAWHFVNRLGYFITNHAVAEDLEVSVFIEDVDDSDFS